MEEREIGRKIVRIVPIDYADPKKGIKLMSYTRFNLVVVVVTGFEGLEYGIGIETRPREGDGPLACFSDEGYADNFLRRETLCPEYKRSNFRVYTCEFIRDTESDRLLWIQVGDEERHGFPLGACPRGTVLCKMIELIEEVVM